jgi:hypothetical protein
MVPTVAETRQDHDADEVALRTAIDAAPYLLSADTVEKEVRPEISPQSFRSSRSSSPTTSNVPTATPPRRCAATGAGNSRSIRTPR